MQVYKRIPTKKQLCLTEHTKQLRKSERKDVATIHHTPLCVAKMKKDYIADQDQSLKAHTTHTLITIPRSHRWLLANSE